MVLFFCHQPVDCIGRSVTHIVAHSGAYHSKPAVIIGQVPFLTPIWIEHTFYHLVPGLYILKVVIDITIVLCV